MAEQVTPPSSSDEQKPPQTTRPVGKLKSLALWEVGLFELGFVLLGLLILFGVFNYFNLLPISKIFPNQLGFLPHRPYQQGGTATRPSNTLIPNQQMSKSNTPPVPAVIKKDIQSFAKSYIKSSLSLPSLDVKPATLANGTILDPNRFGAYWAIGNGVSISISARYGQDLVAQDRSVLVAFPESINLNNLTADSNTSKYFLVQAKGTWNCGKEMAGGKEFTNCVNFWIDAQNIKKEINIISFSSATNNQNTSIAFCERTTQSIFYGWKSCYSQK